jgi:hypothetical protein
MATIATEHLGGTVPYLSIDGNKNVKSVRLQEKVIK